MKICHITSMHDPIDDRIFERACRGLVRLGHRVDFIVPHTHSEAVAGVNILPLKIRKGLSRRIFTSWEAYRRAVRTECDVYHFHDPDLVPWMLLLNRKGRPVVYDLHENYENRFYLLNLPQWMRALLARMVRCADGFAIPRFAGIVTVTESMGEHYQHLAKTRVTINNTVDLQRLSHLNMDQPKAAQPVICTTGTHSKVRRCMQTVEALPRILERVPDARMVFYGRYEPAGYKQQLWERAKVLGVENHLELGDMIPWEENFERVARTLVGCMVPNNSLTLPNRLFEYMFCGVAMLAQDGVEPRRFVETYKCGVLVDFASSSSIAKGAIELLSDPERAVEMGRNGRRATLEKINFNTELAELVKFYRVLSDASKSVANPAGNRKE